MVSIQLPPPNHLHKQDLSSHDPTERFPCCLPDSRHSQLLSCLLGTSAGPIEEIIGSILPAYNSFLTACNSGKCSYLSCTLRSHLINTVSPSLSSLRATSLPNLTRNSMFYRLLIIRSFLVKHLLSSRCWTLPSLVGYPLINIRPISSLRRSGKSLLSWRYILVI